MIHRFRAPLTAAALSAALILAAGCKSDDQNCLDVVVPSITGSLQRTPRRLSSAVRSC